MAKKKKDEAAAAEEGKEKGGSKILSAIIVLVIVLIWLFALAIVIKSNVGGFGDSLRPILKDVPMVNKILPKDSSSDAIALNQYPYRNLSEAVARIQQLESELNQTKESKTTDGSTISELQAEVERLKAFEENQRAFEERVKEFDDNVVFNDKAPEVSEYAKYYEGVNPENAEEIYRQVIERKIKDEKIAKQAEQFSKMDPASAAQILEVMTGDLDLVVGILDGMSTTKSSAILQNMSVEMAAQLTKKLSVTD